MRGGVGSCEGVWGGWGGCGVVLGGVLVVITLRDTQVHTQFMLYVQPSSSLGFTTAVAVL